MNMSPPFPELVLHDPKSHPPLEQAICINDWAWYPRRRISGQVADGRGVLTSQVRARYLGPDGSEFVETQNSIYRLGTKSLA